MTTDSTIPPLARPKVGKAPSVPVLVTQKTAPKYHLKLVLLCLPLLCAMASVGQSKHEPDQETAEPEIFYGEETVIFKDGNSSIVGQFARITEEKDQFTQLHAAHANQQEAKNLLSIISKY